MNLTLINADLSQAELRVMALLSGDPWMMEALQEGAGDFFDTFLMPVAYPKIIGPRGMYETAEDLKADDPVLHKELRTKVKAVVYGLSFARGAAAIAKSLGMPVDEAQAIIDNFLGRANKFAQWREDVKRAAVDPSKRDMLITPTGRRFQSEIVTNANYAAVQREALAFLPQGTASDICLLTAMRINKPLQELDYHIFNLVHDAIMVEGPEENVEYVEQYIVSEMRETGRMIFGDAVPFLADASHGPSWADLS